MRRPVYDRKPFVIGLSFILLLFLALCLLPRGAGRFGALVLSLLYAGLSFYYLKKTPYASVHRRAVLLVTALVAVLYTALVLFSGFRFGFYLADVSFSSKTLFAYILPITVTVIATEFTRGAFLGQKGRVPWAIAFVIGILSEVLLGTTFSTVTNFYHFMDLVGAMLLPALAAQPLYQYTGKHYGILPAVVYRLITSLSPFLIPIKSGIPDSLSSFLSLLVPPVLLVFLRLLYGRTVKATKEKRAGKWTYAVTAVVLVFALSFMMLISCEFRYKLLIIATESMTGAIDKGDGVIYEEYTGQHIEEEDVIVFLLDDLVTVHRVVEVTHVNGENRYYTKGDANDTPDRGFATDEEVLGVVKAKVPYFGYPTLWLRGAFN